MISNIQGKDYFFLIDTELYNHILNAIKKHNITHPKGKNYLKMDVVFFFVNLICYRELRVKDKTEHGYVPLKAEYLKKYHHN